MLTAGQLIWASFRPLIRLAICVSAGFFLTKADRFPPIAARGAGQAILNIALPCLMFSKIVPAFSPLILVSVVYEILGVVISWVTERFFWVPHRFRYGIYVAGGWGNWGDIPTSVILSVTGAAPFNGTTDQTVSVAYISVFILVYMVTLFPCGAHRWIAKDFVGPDVEPEEVRAAVKKRRRFILEVIPRLGSALRRRKPALDMEKEAHVEEALDEKDATSTHEHPVATSSTSEIGVTPRHVHHKHVSFVDDATTAVPTDGVLSTPCSPTPTEVGAPRSKFDQPIVSSSSPKEILPINNTSSSSLSPTIKACAQRFLKILISLLDPPSVIIILSIIIALINPLKALFVPVPSESIHIHPAPDNQPPLAFITDAATFIGAASVPLGLICLGSALARLNVPRDQWRRLPLGAISSLAVGKLIVTPVFGVGLVKGLVRGGVISKEDKVLQFVCVFFSCLPTSSTQVLLTQVYSGTGSAEHLPPFLIPQYILMFITMTGLTAYTLQSLF